MEEKHIVPVTTLTNGVRVANFSSPHSFVFVDGKVLEACSKERSEKLALEAEEVSTMNPTCWDQKGIPVKDISLTWKMTEAVARELDNLYASGGFDILIVPLPVMTAIKAAKRHIGKARCIRTFDRNSKTVCIDKFCT